MSSTLERPDIRVVSRILEALWKSGGPLRPTQLQQASGTNYSQFQRYLEFLRNRELLEVIEVDGNSRIRLTPKGVEAHAFLVQLISTLLSGSVEGYQTIRK
jgi:predicted transcriptional regulator